MNEFCKSIGGSMVTIHSQYDNDLLRRAFPADMTLLGVTREGQSWKWQDQKAHSFNSWATGEPNNHSGEENCITFINGGKNDGEWNDVSCYMLVYTVCKLHDCDAFIASQRGSENYAPANNFDKSIKNFNSSMIAQLLFKMESSMHQQSN
ncbi:macrophage mannose receptor 1-like protein [Leptotrombidium deliense]|uniref:Macrophage mannose receptor 1-like protein n=1 Tax=Leptotrombidium deliense TaxID=299467 RepID=A0A443SE40_9ACAR|nr:macrophage mannose receptor 1-like protein [Leptotrombidium deliense]